MRALFDPEKPPLFFYHRESPFSHHHPSPFVLNGVNFFHMEGFLMFCKAMLFNDKRTAQKILECFSPQGAKQLGRLVEPFDPVLWAFKSKSFAAQGDIAKFTQNIHCYRALMDSDDRQLVEASATDRLWGIGMSADDPRIMRRELWGENRCGDSLMHARRFFWSNA